MSSAHLAALTAPCTKPPRSKLKIISALLERKKSDCHIVVIDMGDVHCSVHGWIRVISYLHSGCRSGVRWVRVFRTEAIVLGWFCFVPAS